MITSPPDSPAALLKAARSLSQLSGSSTAGLWPRASALLARQALEKAMRELHEAWAPGLAGCSARTQLLCLKTSLGDEMLAEKGAHAWASLSRACHYHAYELAPGADELAGLIAGAEEVAEAVHARIDAGTPGRQGG